MGLFSMSASIHETPLPVGRVSFGPPSKSEVEMRRDRLTHPRQFVTPALVTPSPNPNPRSFVIERMVGYESNGALLAIVRYPDCTTFEGRKVLLFASTTVGQLTSATVLDPHFTDKAPEGALVPVARFEPTERGWRLALLCAAAL